MAGISATQRTLKAQREQGRICGIVERFIQYAGKFGQRKDLFGFVDIICIDPVEGIIAIQSCGQSFSEHLHKLMEERNEAVFEWLKAKGKIEMWGWRKVKLHRGGVAMRWKPRIADFFLEDGEVIFKERK